MALAGPHGGQCLNIGSRKQLFLDDDYIVETSVRVRAVMHQPIKHGFPVLSPEKPWEDGGFHTGSVMFDEGILKMWYGCLDLTMKTQCFAYATSRDGINWVRPALNLVDWEGSRDNNIVLTRAEGEDNLGTVCVFKDPAEQDDERLYKMVFHYIRKRGDGYLYGLQAATSPDGLSWTRIAQPLFTDEKPFDAHNVVFWDGFLERYVAYVRRRVLRRLPPEKRFPSEPTARRYVGRSESRDFVHWSSPEAIAFGPDEWDPPESDYYGSGAFWYADNTYLMMTPFFDHATDQVSIRLASSRENVRWRLAGGRAPFLPNGDRHAWDSMQIYPLVPAVQHGDEVLIYYLGLDCGHYAGRATEGYRSRGGIGLATLPLDGFVSLQSGYLPGVVTTWPVRFSGSCLLLNMEAVQVDPAIWPSAGVSVELLDEEGYVIPEFSRHDCDILKEGGSARMVTWHGRSDLSSLAGKPAKIRFHLQFASLYAFQFSEP